MLYHFTLLYHLPSLVPITRPLASFWQQLSAALLHLHAPVHGSPTLQQLHFFDLYPDWQPQLTISSQLSGTGARDISLDTSLPFSFVQAMVSGSGRVPGCGTPFVSITLLGSAPFKYAIVLHHSSEEELLLTGIYRKWMLRALHCSSLRQLHYTFCKWTSQRTSLSNHPDHHFLGFSSARGVLWTSPMPFSCYGQQRKRLCHSPLLHERRNWFPPQGLLALDSHESCELVDTNKLLRHSSSHQQLLEAHFFEVWTKRRYTSVSWKETTRNSASEYTQWRIIQASASSWKPLRALMWMFECNSNDCIFLLESANNNYDFIGWGSCN